MARMILVALTDAVEGHEDEFNRWYTEVHLHEVMAIPGYVSAQRFRRTSPHAGDEPVEQGQYRAPPRYLALYELQTDNLPETYGLLQAAIAKRGPSAGLKLLDPDTTMTGYYEAITDVIPQS